MNKVYGLLADFSYIREGRTRIVVSYNLVPLEDEVHATWCEVVFYKKITPNPSFEQIKAAILQDIDDTVKTQIIEDMVWNGHNVWLSLENQSNYKNALDIATRTDGSNLPYKVRFGSVDAPEYHEFETVSELEGFWCDCSNHIVSKLNAGWALKDSIDWDKYK